MIKKILFWFLFFFIGYTFVFLPVIRKVNNKGIYYSNGYQENKVKAQNFFTDITTKNVIVGSSLSNRLKIDGFYNLSFPGGSALSGLKLIQLRGKYPEVLLIETNTLNRKADDYILNAVNGSILYKLSTLFPSLKEDAQPMNYVSLPFLNERNTTENQVDSILFEKLLKLAIGEGSNLTGKHLIVKQMDSLKSVVDDFILHKVKVYFIQMPMHRKVEESEIPIFIRSATMKTFPPGQKYQWIIDEKNDYETSDGNHLTIKGAEKFSQFILDRIKEAN